MNDAVAPRGRLGKRNDVDVSVIAIAVGDGHGHFEAHARALKIARDQSEGRESCSTDRLVHRFISEIARAIAGEQVECHERPIVFLDVGVFTSATRSMYPSSL